ncbi:Forkhead box protein L1 [Zancudomyces culisetae]|uniref:Forkhead box protein L1 n=1 Tax=Zancudomyces culisetae TaxID=1213189 RepID=A0A1R1PR79_ZANCU|nr:Forkhead box protein L1 [Zancudomyces culisetae]|eukprot:OMH83413.1 Forkhead box protein L1 [Zancudomyces culisetae]
MNSSFNFSKEITVSEQNPSIPNKMGNPSNGIGFAPSYGAPLICAPSSNVSQFNSATYKANTIKPEFYSRASGASGFNNTMMMSSGYVNYQEMLSLRGYGFNRYYPTQGGYYKDQLGFTNRARYSQQASDSGFLNKPDYSYASLIAQALDDSADKRKTLNDIYEWILKKYPYFKDHQGWQNSIRHNLSLNKGFTKVKRGDSIPGKGSFWTFTPGYEKMLVDGVFKTIRSRAKICNGSTEIKNNTVLDNVPPVKDENQGVQASDEDTKTALMKSEDTLVETKSEDTMQAVVSEPSTGCSITEVGETLQECENNRKPAIPSAESVKGRPLALSLVPTIQPKRSLSSLEDNLAAYIDLPSPTKRRKANTNSTTGAKSIKSNRLTKSCDRPSIKIAQKRNKPSRLTNLTPSRSASTPASAFPLLSQSLSARALEGNTSPVDLLSSSLTTSVNPSTNSNAKLQDTCDTINQKCLTDSFPLSIETQSAVSSPSHITLNTQQSFESVQNNGFGTDLSQLLSEYSTIRNLSPGTFSNSTFVSSPEQPVNSSQPTIGSDSMQSLSTTFGMLQNSVQSCFGQDCLFGTFSSAFANSLVSAENYTCSITDPNNTFSSSSTLISPLESDANLAGESFLSDVTLGTIGLAPSSLPFVGSSHPFSEFTGIPSLRKPTEIKLSEYITEDAINSLMTPLDSFHNTNAPLASLPF